MRCLHVRNVNDCNITVEYIVCSMLLQLYLLKKHLKLSSNDKALSANLLGTGLSHAFLKAMVCLLGKMLFLSYYAPYFCQCVIHKCFVCCDCL